MRFVWVCVCLALTAIGCSISPPDETGVANKGVETESDAPQCRETLLAWGSGAGQVGVMPAGEERLARGAPALAVAQSGLLFLLDSVNGRVLAVDRAGTAHAFAEVSRDAEEIAVGPDGAVAVFSPLRSRVWVFGPDGAPAGELAVPRSLRNLTGISLKSSRRIEVHNAYQDTFDLGSPAVPLDEPSMLRSKSEGAILIADGRGVKARASSDRTVEMIVVRNEHGKTENRHRETRYPLPLAADALQIAGATGNTACFRTETLDPAAHRVVVSRQVVCADTESGRVLFQSALPAPGAYVPRREVAVGGAKPTVAWHHPETDGLRVVTCEVAP